MGTGLKQGKSRDASSGRRYVGFGGWVAVFWTFSCLMVIWHVTTVTGSGRGLEMMFETPQNAALMRVVVWLKVWLWAPFLILAPLGHRLMPSVTILTVLVAAIGESAVVLFLLDLDQGKANAIILFNAIVALAFCSFLLMSKRVAAIRASTRPVDIRVRRHFALLVIVAGSVSLAIFGAAPETATDRVSFLTAYLFMILMMVVLAIGPLRALRTGRAVFNSHLRRDVAIWLAISGMLHVYAGTVQSMTPLYVGTFVQIGPDASAVALRQELFSWGTIAGLAILVFLLLLLALSNDVSIIRIGKRWWKRMHRTTYAVFVLTIAHGVAFQFLEYRATWLIALLLLSSGAILGIQFAGFAAVRRRRRRRRSLR